MAVIVLITQIGYQRIGRTEFRSELVPVRCCHHTALFWPIPECQEALELEEELEPVDELDEEDDLSAAALDLYSLLR